MKASFIACTALLAGTAVGAHAGTLDITFDGFCDGANVSFGTNGVAFGTETGCASGPAVGTKGSIRGQGGHEYSLSLDHLPNAIYVIRSNHTWSIYLSDGSDLQDGTWSAANGVRADANLPRSGQR